MTNTIFHLSLAMALFISSHLLMSTKRFRGGIVSHYGKYGFLGVYSLVSSFFLGWSIYAFIFAPHIPIFESNPTLKQISLSLMMFSTFFVVTGYTTPNPGIMGMERVGLRVGATGVLKITRHPVMWGVALWGISHILGNGHQAAAIFFGGITFLALAGAVHIDMKRRTRYGENWIRYENETSFWPMMAIATGRTRIERGEITGWQTVLSILIFIFMLWAHLEMGREVI